MNVCRESMALKQKVRVLRRAADVFEIWPCAASKLNNLASGTRHKTASLLMLAASSISVKKEMHTV
jgi:hypothetical protein